MGGKGKKKGEEKKKEKERKEKEEEKKKKEGGKKAPKKKAGRPETRACYNCGTAGHLAAQCPEPKKATPPGTPRGGQKPAPGTGGSSARKTPDHVVLERVDTTQPYIFALTRGMKGAQCRSPQSGAGCQNTGADNHQCPVKRKVLPRGRRPGCVAGLLLVVAGLLPCGVARDEEAPLQGLFEKNPGPAWQPVLGDQVAGPAGLAMPGGNITEEPVAMPGPPI